MVFNPTKYHITYTTAVVLRSTAAVARGMLPRTFQEKSSGPLSPPAARLFVTTVASTCLLYWCMMFYQPLINLLDRVPSTAVVRDLLFGARVAILSAMCIFVVGYDTIFAYIYCCTALQSTPALFVYISVLFCVFLWRHQQCIYTALRGSREDL